MVRLGQRNFSVVFFTLAEPDHFRNGPQLGVGYRVIYE